MLPLFLIACSGAGSAPTELTAFTPMAGQLECKSIDAPEVTGAVRDPRLPEISSVLVSRKHPNTLWVINDSGNPAELFALAPNGDVVGSFAVKGAHAFDWEGLGQQARDGKHWIYIADTGDNLHIRPAGVVYVVEEPDVLVQGGTIEVTREITLSYPSGRENVEAFAIEPTSGAIYFFTRGDDHGVATLYRRDEKIGKVSSFSLGFESVRGSNLTTSADFDASGERFIARTYVAAYLWSRAPDESWTAAFARAPCMLALHKDRQGEAIAFDDTGFFTLSEKVGEPIRHYRFR